MKKVSLLLLSVLLGLSFSSCSVSSGVSPNSGSDSSSSSFSSSFEEESNLNSLTDDRIKELVENNLNCLFDIF